MPHREASYNGYLTRHRLFQVFCVEQNTSFAEGLCKAKYLAHSPHSGLWELISASSH